MTILKSFPLQKTHHWNSVSSILYHRRMNKMLMKVICKLSNPVEKELSNKYIGLD